MKCVICHGDNIKITKIKEELNIGNDIVYIPLEIHVCESCGERYYTRKTIKLLEELKEELQANKGNLKEIGKVLIYN